MSSIWPYVQPSTTPNTVYYNYSVLTEAQVRQVVAEELQKALYPEESRPSATVEYVIEGKRYKGTVYLVEDEEDARFLIAILHDLFPVKTVHVVSMLTQEDVQHFCKQLDRATPMIKAMLHDRIGKEIPHD